MPGFLYRLKPLHGANISPEKLLGGKPDFGDCTAVGIFLRLKTVFGGPVAVDDFASCEDWLRDIDASIINIIWCLDAKIGESASQILKQKKIALVKSSRKTRKRESTPATQLHLRFII